MASHEQENAERLLRKRVSSFLRSRASHRATLWPFLRQVSELGGSAFLFGGMLRDLMWFGLRKDPRDVDVVVSTLSDALRSYLHPHVRKNTRFGGVELRLGHWECDLWELASTWAFRCGRVRAEGYESLPKTTFLDVQAIAVEITNRPGHIPRVFEHGFFRAIGQQTVGINYEDNPYPARCVLSAMTTVHKLGFSMAPQLIRYVLHYGKHIDLQELCLYQQKQLGQVPFSVDTLSMWMDHLASCYRRNPSCSAKLPTECKRTQKPLPWHESLIAGTTSGGCQMSQPGG